MLYVYPDFARRRVACALLQQAEQAARALDLRRLYTAASITAREADHRGPRFAAVTS